MSSPRLRRTLIALRLLASAGALSAAPNPALVPAAVSPAGAVSPDGGSWRVQAGEVDVDAAVATISAERAAHGLPPVVVDPRLTRIAALHARRMAAADRVAHVLPGETSFAHRLEEGDFAAAQAAENVGAGPATLAGALELWRRSPAHEGNLLLTGVSKIGIALALAPEGRYRAYWSLVLAADGGETAIDLDRIEVRTVARQSAPH